jgi:hypothetical protein
MLLHVKGAMLHAFGTLQTMVLHQVQDPASCRNSHKDRSAPAIRCLAVNSKSGMSGRSCTIEHAFSQSTRDRLMDCVSFPRGIAIPLELSELTNPHNPAV